MILIINNHSGYLRDLTTVLKKLKTKYLIKDQKSPLEDINRNKIKGIILSGGGPNLDKKISLNQIRADIVSLVDFDIPILGICEGHEIIADVFGGEINSLKKYVSKNNEVKILKKTKIFEGLPSKIKGYESHKRFVETMPKEFVLSASSRINKVEAMFHKTRPIFTTQFHPEYSEENGKKIIENFIEICNK